MTNVVISWKPSGDVMKLPIVRPTAVKPAAATTTVNKVNKTDSTV